MRLFFLIILLTPWFALADAPPLGKATEQYSLPVVLPDSQIALISGGGGGSATSANQVTEIARLTSILSTLGSPMQNSGGSVTCNAGTNLNTSTLALESGGHLASIDTKTPALGQALAAGSVPVVLTAAQLSTLTPNGLTDTQLRASAVPVSLASVPLPTGASTAANQTTANASLSSIDTKLTSPLSVTGPLTDTQLRASAVPVSLASVPLPTGAATAANQSTEITALGTINTTLGTPMQNSGGSVTANAGTNLNTSLLALDTSVNGILLAQNSTTSGQSGPLTQGAVTTSAPSYTTAKTSPLSLTTAGGLRTDLSGTTLPLPTGAATSANQSTEITALGTINTTLGTPMQNSGGSVTANAGTNLNTSALALSATQTNGNQKTQIVDGSGNVVGPVTTLSAVNYQPVVLASSATPGAAVPARSIMVAGNDGTNAQSLSVDTTGKLNLNNISGAVSLPTGASTAANQATEISSLSSIDGKLNSLGQKTSANSVPVVLASDQSSITVAGSIASSGSGSSAGATVSTVVTLTAPANATGFFLMNMDTSTTNMRWSIGRTATTTLGQQLQPGRDTGFVPCGANVSIVAESGTVTYDIQWVIR